MAERTPDSSRQLRDDDQDGVPGGLTPAVSLDEYLAVRTQIELLQAKLELLKPAVVEMLALQGGRMTYAGYELCVRSRTAYDYSQAVAAAERHCRQLKRQEQKNGTAIVRSFTEFPYVRAL